MVLWLIYPPFDIEHYILVFTLPVIFGGLLLRKAFQYRLVTFTRNLYILAGIITLKPMVTTPIWRAIAQPILSGTYDNSATFQSTLLLSILPGAGLTILLLIIFRSIYFTYRNTAAWTALLFDCMRWLNSLLALVVLSARSLSNISYLIVLSLCGNFMPSIFAVFIYAIFTKRHNLLEQLADKSNE